MAEDIVDVKVDIREVMKVIDQIKPTLEKLDRQMLLMVGLMIASSSMKPTMELDEVKGIVRGMSEWLSLYFSETSGSIN